jgi:hypothetical protein
MRSATLFLAAAVCTLTACAYRDINPEAAAADERANNGYDALGSVEPGTAKLVLRARGAGYPAHFSVSASSQVCRDFVPSGYVAYSGRGIVLPWIARMNERTRSGVTGQQPYLVHEAKPGVPLQVRGYGYIQDGHGGLARFGHCGPAVVRFTPEQGRAYTVEFIWSGNAACGLSVMDATAPDAPVPVSAEVIEDCPAPG